MGLVRVTRLELAIAPHKAALCGGLAPLIAQKRGTPRFCGGGSEFDSDHQSKIKNRLPAVLYFGASDEARTRYRTPQSCALRGPRTSGLHINAARRVDRWRQRVRFCPSTQNKKPPMAVLYFGASDEARTRYLHLGKVALYQMSYTRGNKSNYSRNFPFVKGKRKNLCRIGIGIIVQTGHRV